MLHCHLFTRNHLGWGGCCGVSLPPDPGCDCLFVHMRVPTVKTLSLHTAKSWCEGQHEPQPGDVNRVLDIRVTSAAPRKRHNCQLQAWDEASRPSTASLSLSVHFGQKGNRCCWRWLKNQEGISEISICCLRVLFCFYKNASILCYLKLKKKVKHRNAFWGKLNSALISCVRLSMSSFCKRRGA